MNAIKQHMIQSAAHAMIEHVDTIFHSHFEEKHTIPSPEYALSITQLNLTQQKLLIDRAKHFVSVTIDQSALAVELNKILDAAVTEARINEFLACGAPKPLMRRLFGMYSSEFSRRKTALQLKGAGNGRPPSCDEATEHQLWHLWQSLENVSEQDRFIQLKNETGLDLRIIWHALQPHIEGSIA